MVSIAVAFGVPYQFWLQTTAAVQALPGTKIRFVAPALRMALIAAFAAPIHCSVGMSCGSFMSPNSTFGLPLNSVASRDQKSAKVAFGIAEPMSAVLAPMYG